MQVERATEDGEAVYVCTEGVYTVTFPVADTEPDDDIETLARFFIGVHVEEQAVAEFREELTAL